MVSSWFFITGTILLSLNSLRLFGLGISDWAYLIATLLAVFETLLSDRRNLSCWITNRLYIPAVIIAFGGLLSTFRSENVNVAIIEIAQSLYVITLFISLTWIMERRGLLNKIVNALIVSGLIAATIAIYDFQTDSMIGSIFSGTVGQIQKIRSAGPFVRPNMLGGFLVLPSAMIKVKIIKGRLAEKILGAFVLLIFLYGIFLSGSNTALAAEILSFGIIFMFAGKEKRRQFYILLLIVICVGLFVVPLIDGFDGINLIIINIERNINRAVNITLDARLDIYKYSINVIQQNPIIGVGYDQLPTSGIAEESRQLPGMVHNTVLSVFYAGGIFSLIGWSAVYLYIVIIVLKFLYSQLIYSDLNYLGLAAAVSSIFIMMQFQTSLYRRDWWLVIGLLIAAYLKTQKEGVYKAQ